MLRDIHFGQTINRRFVNL